MYFNIMCTLVSCLQLSWGLLWHLLVFLHLVVPAGDPVGSQGYLRRQHPLVRGGGRNCVRVKVHEGRKHLNNYLKLGAMYITRMVGLCVCV